MNPSHGIRMAFVAVLALAVAGCVENSYRSKNGGDVVVVNDVPSDSPAAEAPAPSTSSSSASSSQSGPSGDAPAVAHQGPAEAEGYTLDGFRVYADDGRLWVFRDGSDNLKSFLAKGEPAKRVTLIGSGPHGKTLLGSDKAAMEDYALAVSNKVEGFAVFAKDGRLWVFKRGSKYLDEFLTKGEPAKRVTLIGQGPNGTTLMGSDTEAMKNYADGARFSVPGFAVVGHDGRLWVFKRDSSAHKSFKSKGEPAKRVTLVAAGPEGKTLMGSDREVLEDFAASHKYRAPGFVVVSDDGRLWVFRQGSEHLASFVTKGEPAKRVTLIGSGPSGKTLLGADKEAMQAYAAAVAN